jgi:hypothetical protein
MFSRTNRDANEELLDEVGEDLVRAARASDGEIDAADVGPLLYSRIRASIAARQRELESPTVGWLSFLRAARFAVPAMALVTVLVTFVPRLGPGAKRNGDRGAAKTAVHANIQGEELRILVFSTSACALSNNEECAISNNEVLATIFADKNEETQR